MPTNRAAWMPGVNSSSLTVLDAPYNPPGQDEVVIKNHAVAINPVDWKMQDSGLHIKDYPTIFGCDVAGIVEEVGQGVHDFQKGDRVISNAVCLVRGMQYAAYQSYVKTPANVTCKLPDSMSFEQGVVLPLAFNTAAIGLFSKEFLSLPLPSIDPPTSEKVVFIYGGSSSVGSTAIQLGRAAGFRVVATASERNFEHCKALGARDVFNYKKADWIDDVVAKLKGEDVIGVYDTVAHDGTPKMCAELLARLDKPDAVLVTTSSPPADVVAKTVFGANITFDHDLARALWAGFLQSALADSKFSPPLKPQIIGSGLDQIQKGIDMQRKGISATKLVVKID